MHSGLLCCVYAITLWFGCQQIADTIQYGYKGYPREQTGGTVYAAFYACFTCAFSIGQLALPLTAFTTARVAAKTFLKVINRKPEINGLSEGGLRPNNRPASKV